MPTHTYLCDNCGHEFDQHQKYSDKSLIKCPECRKHALRKVYKPARIVFKGSGFYTTDNRSKSRVASNSNGKSDTSDTKEGKRDSEKAPKDADSKNSNESKSQAKESKPGSNEKSTKSD